MDRQNNKLIRFLFGKNLSNNPISEIVFELNASLIRIQKNKTNNA